MTEPAPNVVAFQPRQPEPDAPLSAFALVSRLLELARELDRSGWPHVAGLLVGAAYAICDGGPPPDNGGLRRTA